MNSQSIIKQQKEKKQKRLQTMNKQLQAIRSDMASLDSSGRYLSKVEVKQLDSALEQACQHLNNLYFNLNSCGSLRVNLTETSLHKWH